MGGGVSVGVADSSHEVSAITGAYLDIDHEGIRGGTSMSSSEGNRKPG